MYRNDKVIRRYSEPFKLKILSELSTGKYTKSELCKLYSIEPTTVNEWKEFPKNGIAIGSDGFGNLIILTHNGNGVLTEVVYFWNHEIGQIGKIAESINELES